MRVKALSFWQALVAIILIYIIAGFAGYIGVMLATLVNAAVFLAYAASWFVEVDADGYMTI